jgi:thiosulfate/3-mercaptopyruvate sulfurtransferase
MTRPTRTVTIDGLRDRLEDPSLTILDVRPLAAYNGWRLGPEVRGGHIPGAAAFPADWLRTVDEPEIARLLAGKGVTSDRDVVVYGDGADDAQAVAERLADFGIDAVTILDAGFAAWAADPTLPIEKLARHERLVHIDWLQQVLAGERPEAAPTGDFLLFHVNFGVPEEYEEAHIPGALYLDTNLLGIRPTGTAAPRRSLIRRSAPSGSPRTRRWSCTAVTPRATRTRSGRVAGPGRSPPPVRS